MSPKYIVRQLGWILIALLPLMLMSWLNYPVAGIKFMIYSDLTKEIDKANIREIVFSSDGEVEGEFKNPVDGKTIFRSTVGKGDSAYLSRKLESQVPRPNIKKRIASGSLWSNLSYFLPIILIAGFWIFMMRRMNSGGLGSGGIGKFLSPRVKQPDSLKPVTFKDVAGVNEAKEELKDVVDFLKDPQKYTKLGGKIPKGILLVGPPGVGKTLLARAVAGEAKVPFFSVSGSDFVEMFVGVGAGRVRNLFESSKKNSPCIIFIDELDAVGRHRGAGLGGGHDEREQTLNQILVEMDGFETNSGIITLAATNRPDVLDPALLRPGRFDRHVVVNKPDVRGRQEILKIHTSSLPLDSDVKLDVLAKSTPGFTGADLANLCNEAALGAAKHDKKNVSMEDFEMAKDKVLMGGERSVIISPKERQITAVHEAGHAIVASLVPEADPVHKVTIIPRGLSMGSTWQLPEDDRHNYSKTYLTSQLAILMAGRCAEEIVFNGEQSTGAGNDIEKATEIARKMICNWGMSDKLGPLKFGTDNDEPFLGKYLGSPSSNYSPHVAEQIDAEMSYLITRAGETATRILKQRISALQMLAQALIEKEILNGEEVKKFLA